MFFQASGILGMSDFGKILTEIQQVWLKSSIFYFKTVISRALLVSQILANNFFSGFVKNAAIGACSWALSTPWDHIVMKCVCPS